MDFIIRDMRVEDIPEVQNVAKTSWNHTYKGIIPLHIQENFLKSAYSDEMMVRRLELSHMFVAIADNKVTGFANFSPLKENGEIELGSIYLYPEYQGNGIGTALLQEAIEKIEGIKEVYINVEKENQTGRNFYDKRGFKIVSEFDDHFDGHILKTVRMVLMV
ncbi:GNAT family N-acetyltransferase [Bacillus sp. S/N-304-OC-R1]|uniref:GNAT family N-acetyltransferase n=1 Tax=Bacillus sp. S/N-304-OC-R1 TaxID=2758034 RepID=UPI001C8E4398|nr:GNAT family N-acetyltransferase [Bacillus sp. S/N-304-OC-R1]MBY0120324.1 GNAT family N-acetyltransferase [Bacillus sp. S/N-304-OC-R1]